MAGFWRIGGLSGIAFVVVFGVSQFTSGEPRRNATQEEIARYIAGHQTSNEVGGIIAFLVSAFVALFAVGVWSLLSSNRSSAWPMTGLLGGMVMAVNLSLVGATIGAQGWLADKLATQAVLAQTVFVFEQALASAILPFIALFLLGMGMSTLESGVLPSWSAWLAFVGVALSAVLTLQFLVSGPVIEAVGIVHALVVLGWIAIVSVYMLLPQSRAMVASARTA